MVYSPPMTRIDRTPLNSRRVLVMGILNVTPDSFFDGGRLDTPDVAVAEGLRMIDDGADLLDIGGESSRPGSDPVTAAQELARVLPVVKGLRARTQAPISIDTTKSVVAESCLREGADMVNDISAMRYDPNMARVVSQAGAAVVLMHMKDTPKTMQNQPHYGDVVKEVADFLRERAAVAVAAGILPTRIILDPGIGFGKTLEHNLALLRALPTFVAIGYPVLIGLSRKSFLGKLLDLPVEERLEATIAANTAAVLGGASILRVHDVREGRRTADVAVRLRS
jgi:dihydropteroate synthase